MDFTAIFRSASKRSLWTDVVFYFVVSSLVASVFCYVIFLTKNGILRENIGQEITKLQDMGTADQKKLEDEVIGYQKKIGDFSELLKNHEFSSNAFVFMEKQTLPNIWFKQFGLDEKTRKIQITGEADNMEDVGRQIASFEKNKYVKSVGALSSSLSESARIQFSTSLTLDPSIFGYVASLPPVEETVSPSDQSITRPIGPTEGIVKNGDKSIISFRLLLQPEVVGAIDLTAHTVVITVPVGQDVKRLVPSIIVSPKATVFPSSNSAQDFTNPVVYKVTAEDGTSQDYTVTVGTINSVAKPVTSPVNPVTTVVAVTPTQSNFNIWIIGLIIGAIIVFILVLFIFIRRRAEKNLGVPQKK